MNCLADHEIVYQIQVYGDVDPGWVAEVTGSSVAEAVPATKTAMLAGVATDQAALVGLINSLYSFGIVIIGMECSLAEESVRRSSSMHRYCGASKDTKASDALLG